MRQLLASEHSDVLKLKNQQPHDLGPAILFMQHFRGLQGRIWTISVPQPELA